MLSPKWLREFCRALDRPAIIAISRVLTILVTLGTAPLVARTLGPEGRGLYAASIAALTLSPIVFGVGIPVAMRRLAAVGNIGAHVRTLYILVPALCIPAVLAALPLVEFLIRHLTPAERISFTIAMAASALYVMTLCAQSVAIAKARYLNVAILQSSQIVIVSILIVAFFVASKLSLNVLLLFYSFATLITAAVSIALMRIPSSGPRSKVKVLLKEGSPYAISQVAEASSSSLYQLLAITALTAGPAGYLAVGMTIASLPIAMAHTIGAVAFREVSNSQPAQTRIVIAKFLRISILLGIGTSAVLLFITPFAVPLIFGDQFRPGVPLIMGVLFGCAALLLNYVGMQMLAAIGKGFRMANAQIWGIALGVSLLYGLAAASIQNTGGLAVAIGWTFTSLIIVLSLPVRLLDLLPRIHDFRSIWSVSVRGQLANNTEKKGIKGAVMLTRPALGNLMRTPTKIMSHGQKPLADKNPVGQKHQTAAAGSRLIAATIYILVALLFSGALIVKFFPVGFTLSMVMVILIGALIATSTNMISANWTIFFPILLIWVLLSTTGLDLSSSAQRYLVIFPIAFITGHLILSTGHIRNFLQAYLSVALVMAFLSIVENQVGRSLIGDDDRFAFIARLREFRSAVAAEHPLILGIYLAVAIVTVAAFSLSAVQRVSVCTVLILGILSTDGRVPLIIGVSAAVLICCFKDATLGSLASKRSWLIVGTISAWSLIAYLSVFQWTNSAYGATAADSSAAYRPAIYSFIPDILSRSYSGIGFADVPQGLWLIRGRSVTYDLANTVDSEVVLLALRFGIFGLLSFAAIWSLFIATCRLDPVIGAMGIVLLVTGFSTAISAWNTLGSFAFMIIGLAFAQILKAGRATRRTNKPTVSTQKDIAV